MIASLTMYRRPELEAEHDRLWAQIRDGLRLAGIKAPDRLSQDAEEAQVWEDPDLVLSQTCGMPYRLGLDKKVRLVGTPDYGLEGCPPGYYRSALVVRRDDPRRALKEFRNARFAFNDSHSQSGHAAAYWHTAAEGFWFKTRIRTGQHRLSALAVSEDEADIAAIDAVSWRLMQAYEPFAEYLRVLDWTTPTPGLPLITGQGNDAEAMFDIVRDAIASLPGTDRSKLGIKTLIRIPEASYQAIKNPPEE